MLHPAATAHIIRVAYRYSPRLSSSFSRIDSEDFHGEGCQGREGWHHSQGCVPPLLLRYSWVDSGRRADTKGNEEEKWDIAHRALYGLPLSFGECLPDNQLVVPSSAIGHFVSGRCPSCELVHIIALQGDPT